MAEQITWIRPSGSEITTNGTDASIARAAELGWVPKDDFKKAEKPTKAEKPAKAD